MWIERHIEAYLAQSAAQRPVLVLTGARQTGKTSLVERLFPNHELVSLDLPSEAEQAEGDPAAFLRRHPPPLVVDEVQYAPKLFRHLKHVVDQQRDRAGLFVLTGSQKLQLMHAVSDSLAGRANVVELETLSWAEASAADASLTVQQFLVRGGFPELHARPELDASSFYRSYVATYLERDVRQLLNVANLRDYERFLRACALRSGNLLNQANLARDVGVAGSTVAAWLGVLQASGQITLLEPWHSNRTKSLVKAPKLYLNDSGLCSFLISLDDARELDASPLAGALWETLVCGELRRSQLNRRGGWNLHFWRDRVREADFLLHRAGRFDLADAKWTQHPDKKDAGGLQRVMEELPAGAAGSGIVICRTPNPYPISSRVTAVSAGTLPPPW